MDTGNRIKARRIELDMTVDELAHRIGKNRATVYRYENGSIEKLPADAIIPIANALNVSKEYLMGWEDSTSTNNEYYYNPETAAMAQQMFENKELRVLFDAARDASPEDLKLVYDMLIALKNKEK